MRRIFLILAWGWLTASVAWAQTVVDTKTASDDDCTTSPITGLTISSVAVSGADRGLACIISNNGNNAVEPSTVVFNGSENLTRIFQVKPGSTSSLDFWYLVAPTAVTADVVMTLSGGNVSSTLLATCVALSDVAQSNPTLADGQECPSPCLAQANSEELTTTVASTMIISGGKHSDPTTTWGYGAGQNELAQFGHACGKGDSMGSSHKTVATPQADTVSTTVTDNGSLQFLAVGVEPAGMASSPGGRRRINTMFQ